MHLLSLDPGHKPWGRARGENPKDEVGGRYCTRGQEGRILALTQHLLCDLGQVILLLWGLSVPLCKIGFGNWEPQRPLSTLLSVVRGVVLTYPQPLSPTQACRAGTCRQGGLESLGRAARQGYWLVTLPTLGQSLVCLFPALYGFLASEAAPQDNCWGLRSPPHPQGKERASPGEGD